jgi:predicted enzyme related to lactoylglutathione lyase
MNSVNYFEIQSSNPEREVKFYQSVFGWKFIKQEFIPIPYYRIETNGINGGLLKRPAPVPPKQSGTNAFVCSIEVSSFDETSKRICELGGKVALPKFAIPGRCWQGYFIDLDDNTFGIFEANPNAK